MSEINSSAFNPPYQEPVNAANMEMFMDPGERQRAQTYYKQLERDAEDRMCHFCKKQITDRD